MSFYLLDSDAAKKICQYQLLQELTIALQCSLANFAVLPQLKFQLKLKNNNKALEKLGSQESVELAKLLVKEASEVEIIAEAANPILSLNRPDIDTGEATLFAALYGSTNDSLLTGDKRAIVALSKVNHVPQVNQLWARILCLEEAIYLILKALDFNKVSSLIRSRPDVDISLSIVFGKSKINTHDEVIEGLVSNIKNIERQTNDKYISKI